MSRTRRQLEAQVGAEIGELVVGARVVTHRAAEAFAKGQPGLRPAAFHVARFLRSKGPLGLTELAAGLDLDKGALSRLLSDLESAGLVTKRGRPDDGRAIAAALTRAGETRLARVLTDKGAELTDRLARFDDGELSMLSELLRRLNEPTHATAVAARTSSR